MTTRAQAEAMVAAAYSVLQKAQRSGDARWIAEATAEYQRAVNNCNAYYAKHGRG